MARGEPDWKKGVRLYAWDGSQLVPILVDDSGQLYAVIKGTDGTQLRTLKVDSEGQIISILKGASGNNVAVDSEGNLSTVIKGNSAGTLIPIAVDSDGNLIAVVKGDYAGTLRTIAVDDQGRMLANLAAQDLAQVITRHGLGARETSGAGPVSIAPTDTYTWVEYSGSGYLYWFFQMVESATDSEYVHARIYIDGTLLRVSPDPSYVAMNEAGFSQDSRPLQLLTYAPDGICSCLYYFNPPIAFDSNLKLEAYNESTYTQSVIGSWFYTKL